MQDDQPNRRAPKGVNLFDRLAIFKAIIAKSTSQQQTKISSVSSIWRGYAGHTDHRSRTFKQNRRKELKAGARARQRRLER